MAHLPPLTSELARRIERLVAPEVHLGRERDPSAPIVARFGRTIASKAIGGRPANKVYCFSHEDLPRLEEILVFYASDGLSPLFS